MVNRRRILLPFLFLVAAFFGVTARLFCIQIWNHEELKTRVEKLIRRERPEQPCRGMILDSQGRLLAMSAKSYLLFADMKTLPDPGEAVRVLSRNGIDAPREEMAQNPNSSFVPLVHGLDENTVRKIKALDLRGLGFAPEYQRRYPEGRMACHLLGVVARDGRGLEGIELSANQYLTGERIKELRYRDGRGREIADKIVDPEDFRGADVYLTIDRNLQFIAEQEAEKAWRDSKSKKAMVIIQDPASGEVLALACRPNFDPGAFSGNILKNPAISDAFEPGSTFKLITAGAALEEKAVSLSEVIWCEEGKYSVFRHTIKDHEKKGFLTLPQIMECSSNIGTAKIGQRLGKENLYRYIRQFGFFSLSGIALPGEARGLLRPPENWSGLSLPVISFGQEIGVTALQLINAYSAVANGGLLLEPRIIREIRTPAGESVEVPGKRVIRRVVSAGTAEALRDMLTGVVERGTGAMAKVPGYSVAGKTGTAQKRDPSTGRYSGSSYIASFCGMIPALKPRLTILVVLDEPQGDYWGSSRAAPVFSRVASRAVHHLQIAPDRRPLNICNVKRYAGAKAR
ncbi:MAG: peptidoglycan D,D-transpeptidase FtsI family protein [Endomicrobiales bacterium]